GVLRVAARYVDDVAEFELPKARARLEKIDDEITAEARNAAAREITGREPSGPTSRVHDGEEILYHKTDEANVAPILEQGINESTAGHVGSEKPGVYGVREETVRRQFDEPVWDPATTDMSAGFPKGMEAGRVYIGYRRGGRPTTEAAGGEGGVHIPGRVEPGDIVGVFRPGDEL